MQVCFRGHAAAVIITNLPPYGSTNLLAGLIQKTETNNFAIAAFTYSDAALWNSKPFCNAQLSIVQPDGSWQTRITTGGGSGSTNATRIAAFLVDPGITNSLSCIQGDSYLPEMLYTNAVAKAITYRPAPGVRWLQFSGYDWFVKSNSTPAGPGPNYFPGTTNTVWVDPAGMLHLRITKKVVGGTNQWQCAEIISARNFGYGSYRFQLATNTAGLDPNIVLGLFTYSDDPAFNQREIDIEYSRWGNASATNNVQFVVQPGNVAGNKLQFVVPANLTNHTASFLWQSNQLAFLCQTGAYSPALAASNVVRSWSYTTAVPPTGDEGVRINFWLYNGNAPTDNNEAEIVLQSFQFVPDGSARPAKLAASLPSQTIFTVGASVQYDWWYQVQSSSNPGTGWQSVASLLATNTFIQFSDSNPPAGSSRFFRFVALP